MTIRDDVRKRGGNMKRSYMVEALKNGEPLSFMLSTGDLMSVHKLVGLRRELLHEFTEPTVEVVRKLGSDRNLVRTGRKPAWWVKVTDGGDASVWPMRCKSESDARAIERWARMRD